MFGEIVAFTPEEIEEIKKLGKIQDTRHKNGGRPTRMQFLPQDSEQNHSRVRTEWAVASYLGVEPYLQRFTKEHDPGFDVYFRGWTIEVKSVRHENAGLPINRKVHHWLPDIQDFWALVAPNPENKWAPVFVGFMPSHLLPGMWNTSTYDPDCMVVKQRYLWPPSDLLDYEPKDPAKIHPDVKAFMRGLGVEI